MCTMSTYVNRKPETLSSMYGCIVYIVSSVKNCNPQPLMCVVEALLFSLYAIHVYVIYYWIEKIRPFVMIPIIMKYSEIWKIIY